MCRRPIFSPAHPAIDSKRTSVIGAASRPIAGKRGSHKYSACLKAGDIPVGAGLPAMRPALTTELWISVRFGSKTVTHDRLLSTHCGHSSEAIIQHQLTNNCLPYSSSSSIKLAIASRCGIGNVDSQSLLSVRAPVAMKARAVISPRRGRA